ncbi:hypothetical protein AOQ84DRAFT_24256 [Glonium stellatum]|uniref:Uncharacterized protein n=1 Tax=Glonium stellatum TaxID=574774 RepID=A0A8E2F2L1_9PEZI|nr:hypothetical protein AOQ84DRAFT_24256 [Glonium stellatum]
MSTTVELGQLVLSYPKANLQLELIASITTALSQGSIDLQQNSSENVLSLLTSKSAWACRGSGLRLVVRVNVDGQPLGAVESENLSRSLINADLWSQLHLHASLPIDHLDVKHSSYKSGSVQIELSHARTDLDIDKQRSHRLSLGVPFADVKPPDGVSVCAVRAICLSIEISRTEQPLRSKKARHPIDYEAKNGADRNSVDLLQDYCYLPSLEEPFQLCLRPRDTIPLSERLDRTKAAFVQLGDKDEVRDFASNDFAQTSCLRKRSAELGLHEVDSTVEQRSELDFSQIMELLDAAIRITICRNPWKISSGVKVKRSNFSASLAEAAPSLWSPDYLSAISQRACLAPVISRALCHSLSKTRSLTLKSKMEDLAARGLRQSSIYRDILSNLPETCQNTHILNQLVAAEFWGFIQSTLFEPSAARRLKPLWQPGACINSTDGSDDLLEEQNTQDAESGFELYFESRDVLESIDDYLDNDSDGELLMASAGDAWMPGAEMRRHGCLETDFDCVHAGDIPQNQGLAAGTLQHDNVVDELTVSHLESTSLDRPRSCTTSNDYHDDIRESFGSLSYVVDSADPMLRLEERFIEDAISDDLILEI